ncbi:hypothetical protein PFISCL1PPCAC_2674, partial [Pristionchus fissidentatus]
ESTDSGIDSPLGSEKTPSREEKTSPFPFDTPPHRDSISPISREEDSARASTSNGSAHSFVSTALSSASYDSETNHERAGGSARLSATIAASAAAAIVVDRERQPPCEEKADHHAEVEIAKPAEAAYLFNGAHGAVQTTAEE